MSARKYAIYCQTEGMFIEGWGTAPPTSCYNNASHDVTTDSVQAFDDPDVGEYAIIQDIKSQNTGGGAYGSTVGAWVQRHLNTLTTQATWCTLSSNQFTLTPGNYIVNVSAPAISTAHRARLYDVSSSAVATLGDNQVSGTMTYSTVQALLNLIEATTFSVETACAAIGTSGTALGSPSNLDDEVYTQVQIQRCM